MARQHVRRLIDSLESRLPPRARAFVDSKARHLLAVNRRAVARGVAIGVFFGFVIPLGQIPAAVLASPFVRANALVAALSTLVTNPLTLPAIYAGAFLLGREALTATGLDAVVAAGPYSWAAATVIGVATFAVGGAVAGFLLVRWWWARSVRARWIARRAARSAAT